MRMLPHVSYVCRNRRTEELKGLFYDRLNPGDSGGGLVRLAEGQYLRDQMLGAFGRLDDGGIILGIVTLFGGAQHAKLPVAENGREQIVEIMGDAACKLSDRFEAFGFLKLEFEPFFLLLVFFSLGNIANDADHA